jgi:cytochrome b pre-mRNA-processing protein 3
VPGVASKSIFTTYTAYGSTEILYKECAAKADYSIPQAKDEDADIPVTEDGEHLGVGESWWHTGRVARNQWKSPTNISQSWG